MFCGQKILPAGLGFSLFVSAALFASSQAANASSDGSFMKGCESVLIEKNKMPIRVGWNDKNFLTLFVPRGYLEDTTFVGAAFYLYRLHPNVTLTATYSTLCPRQTNAERKDRSQTFELLIPFRNKAIFQSDYMQTFHPPYKMEKRSPDGLIEYRHEHTVVPQPRIYFYDGDKIVPRTIIKCPRISVAYSPDLPCEIEFDASPNLGARIVIRGSEISNWKSLVADTNKLIDALRVDTP